MSIEKREFGTAEATSLGVFGGGWKRNSRIDISSATQKHHTIDLDATRILLQPDCDIYVYIDGEPTTANVAASDLKLVGDGLSIHELSVPKGIQAGDQTKQLYLHILQVTSVALQYCKIVEA